MPQMKPRSISPRFRNGAFALLFLISGAAIDRFLPTVTDVTASDQQLADQPSYETLEELWQVIHDQWPLPEDIDDQALIMGAAKGMIDALGDDGHSRFVPSEDAEEFYTESSGTYSGIGVEMDFRDARPRVVWAFPNSPALAAGLRQGDSILAVDGEDTMFATAEEVAGMLLGEAGTQVSVTYLREGASLPATVVITRGSIDVPIVTWRMLPGEIAQIRLIDFSAKATSEMQRVLSEIRESKAKGVILDLRGNGGGLLAQAIGVASEFMDEGNVLFQQQNRDGSVNPVQTLGRKGSWLDGPLVVLIDRESASAAEILASSLSENDRATTIGEKTFGTGTVLTPFTLEDGSIAVLGTALWLSSDGDQLWKEGVEPDLKVVLPTSVFPSRPADGPMATLEDLKDSGDSQLITGLRTIMEVIEAEEGNVTPEATPAA